MTEEQNRLNIERAREALARARSEQTASAVRSPRPADLSRLAESEARRLSIDTHAVSFRDTVRERLDLGAYRGQSAQTAQVLSGLMSAPVCDADVCMPAHPAFEAPAKTKEPKQTIEAEPAQLSDAGVSEKISADTISLNESLNPAHSIEEAPQSTPADPAEAESEKPKRRKFLGIF